MIGGITLSNIKSLDRNDMENIGLRGEVLIVLMLYGRLKTCQKTHISHF